MSPFAGKLATLDAKPIANRREPTERDVKVFEKQFSLSLPADYRDFLVKHAGTWVTALSPIKEPCPCGQDAVLEAFFGFMPDSDDCWDIRWATSISEGAPAAIPIAAGGFGSWIYLKLTGEDAQHVYCYDAEQRYFWPDTEFHERYGALATELKLWLKKRKDQQLPPKRKGYENFYHMADTFSEFFEHSTYFDMDPPTE